jgi:signal transduction histidine kinase
MQFPAGVWVSVVSAVVAAAVAAYAHGRDVPGARGVAAFGASAAVWAAGNAVQVAATSLDAKLLAVDVQYVGILALPVAWFVFAAEYTGREQWVNRWSVGALAVFPVVLFVAVLTNETHHLVRTDATVETVGTVVRIAREFGPLFWVATAYSWMVSSVGTMLLVEHSIRVDRDYRRQTVAVLLGATVPWVAQTLYLAGATTIEPESLFGVTAVAFGYAMVRHDMLDLVPVARDHVFEELDDGVLVLDTHDRVVDYNDAAERLLGVDVERGTDLDTGVLTAVRDSLPSDERDTVRVEGDGGGRHLNVDVSPVGDRGIGSLVLLRDVTELERRRSELDRENDRLDRVTDTISHDLRNPLNVADGYLELAEESGDSQDFERVRDALDRMDNIIEGALRMARTDLQAPKRSDLELGEIAERAWLNVVTNGATLDLDCANATVRADPDQLESLLENVFRNSVEHGSTGDQNGRRSGGGVEQESTSADSMARQEGGEREVDRVSITVGVLEDRDGFYVADDGPGIPEAERHEVFERGYTTSDTGTGLGLAIVADVADAHGWEVELVGSGAGGARLNVRGVTAAVQRAGEA